MNYSIQGACTSTSVPDCTSSVADEIGQVPSDFNPSIITVTVGADDINFAGCIKSMFLDGDLALTASTDPCNNTRLTASLAALKVNLTADLQTLITNYPHAAIYVMDYYNPFPPPVNPGQSTCALSKGIAVLYEYAKLKSWWKVAKLYVEHRHKFAADAEFVQSQLFNDAGSILDQLNSTINSTTGDLATVFNTNDFAGHDICASSDRWVFSPRLALNMSFKAGPMQVPVPPLSFGDPRCPDPVAPDDWNRTIDANFDTTSFGVEISGNIDLSLGVNCLPHPNTAGQYAIASDFMQQTGQ